MKPGQITRWKREGDIGVLLLNNPPQNYLEEPEFIAIDELRSYVDSEIKALVITGVGRHFSAGAKFESLSEQIGRNVFGDLLKKGNELLDYIDALKIPTVAVVTGACFGAGLEIALACDIRVCSDEALFAFPEINHELIPGMGGMKRLRDIVGEATSLEIVFKGDIISTELASQFKLVDIVTSRKEVMNYTLSLLQKMTNDRPLKVINSVMKSVNNHHVLGREEAIEKDVELFCELAIDAFDKQEENK